MLTVEIENIEKMRRDVGIEDSELRAQIRRLRVGNHVNLTFLTDDGRFRSETLVVRITSIKSTTFRGKLIESPTLLGESNLHEGTLVTFKKDHIHSIPTRVPSARVNGDVQDSETT